MPDNSNIDEMVQEILADMSLKEKAAIANLDEDKSPICNMPSMSVFAASSVRMMK
jgi:hypothetical protein